MLEWQEARCSDTHLSKVFWEAHQRPHLLCAACLTGPTTICIPQKPFPQTTLLPSPAHCSLHLENKNTYVRMLFVDYSSAFNTIVPATWLRSSRSGTEQISVQLDPGLPDRQKSGVRMGNNTSSPLISTLVPRRAASQPTPVCLYTRLYSYTQLQHRQICRWHNGDRPDHRQRWDGLQRGGEYPD